MRKMELAIFWLPIIGGILLGGIAGAAWYGGNKIFGLWAGFFGVICLLLVGVFQIQNAVLSSAERSNSSEASEKRAFIILDVIARPYPPLNPNRFAISLVVTNAGPVWASNLRVQNAVVTQSGPVVETDPFEVAQAQAKKDSRTAEPLVIGPQQTQTFQFADVPFSDVPKIAKGELRQTYVAWATYGTAARPYQTQMSKRLNGDTEGGISFTILPNHNCVDDDCPKEGSGASEPH